MEPNPCDRAAVRLYAHFLQTFAFLWDRDRKPYRVTLEWEESDPAAADPWELDSYEGHWSVLDLEAPVVTVLVRPGVHEEWVPALVREAFARVVELREGVSRWEAEQRLADLTRAFVRYDGDPAKLVRSTAELAAEFLPVELLVRSLEEEQDLADLEGQFTE